MTTWKPFLFGKMPAHGDFVSRGLAGQHRTAWDIWCSDGLALAREALGDAFIDLHSQAEACCFWFGPGPFGRGWRMGALASVQDRVRRPFLLVLGVESRARPCVEVANAYPERLLSLIAQAIVEGWNADETVDRMPAVPGCDADHSLPQPVISGRFWTGRGAVMTCRAATSVPPETLIPMMMNIKEVIDVSGPAI